MEKSTNTTRQREFRKRMVEKGAVQVTSWIPREMKDRHAAYVARLMKEAGLK